MRKFSFKKLFKLIKKNPQFQFSLAFDDITKGTRRRFKVYDGALNQGVNLEGLLEFLEDTKDMYPYVLVFYSDYSAGRHYMEDFEGIFRVKSKLEVTQFHRKLEDFISAAKQEVEILRKAKDIVAYLERNRRG